VAEIAPADRGSRSWLQVGTPRTAKSTGRSMLQVLDVVKLRH
jgi:hypothetical protein